MKKMKRCDMVYNCPKCGEKVLITFLPRHNIFQCLNIDCDWAWINSPFDTIYVPITKDNHLTKYDTHRIIMDDLWEVPK